MILRCRPGDIAVMSCCAVPRNIGAVVRILEQAGPGKWLVVAMHPVRAFRCSSQGIVLADVILRVGDTVHCRDDNLRPLRDRRGDDETLGWPCGRPPRIDNHDTNGGS